ncbi:universal stress protein [Haloplanus halobius]|uniref:universal stress protein n=1 Tax=Haloplanus halobius TaxID=2934938 RepID=UPI00200D4945|nr:universal stress protein [Haloplanus sp. XH21]
MPELLVPLSQREEQVDRIVEGISDLHYDPAETHLTLLNVFEEFEVHGEWSDIDSGQFYDAEELPEAVTAAASRLSEKGFTVDVYHRHGDPAESILNVASELEPDAIVMAGRQRSPIGKVLLGSVTQGVLLGTDRPVIVIPDGG